ncbi:hypothetical protein [Bradyrhizobium sp. AUGA SZCCT0431]|uniref:hypothetical protein n=1 Tax=Bradyrhizobium sp. AUGA SZCCT0431 TaxID=2807674 RepID=UPI001BA50C6B|nr:hypothetical protein [Bradyrhizobium sp. AUGA SZCCT0431]MBR1144642.1 hypothetical protein [Bradyrhizobium sp. AUGA SZCCT0431]
MQDQHECQQRVSRTVLPTAFELAEGTVRTFQIAFAEARDDDDIVDSSIVWLTSMAPYWLIRLNGLLAWLNPALGGVAAILALLVIATAAERLPRNGSGAIAQAARPVSAVAPAECVRAALPPELRDLRLHD